MLDHCHLLIMWLPAGQFHSEAQRLIRWKKKKEKTRYKSNPKPSKDKEIFSASHLTSAQRRHFKFRGDKAEDTNMQEAKGDRPSEQIQHQVRWTSPQTPPTRRDLKDYGLGDNDNHVPRLIHFKSRIVVYNKIYIIKGVALTGWTKVTPESTFRLPTGAKSVVIQLAVRILPAGPFCWRVKYLGRIKWPGQSWQSLCVPRDLHQGLLELLHPRATAYKRSLRIRRNTMVNNRVGQVTSLYSEARVTPVQTACASFPCSWHERAGSSCRPQKHWK